MKRFMNNNVILSLWWDSVGLIVKIRLETLKSLKCQKVLGKSITNSFLKNKKEYLINIKINKEKVITIDLTYSK
jgi:hypothetical protein